MSKIKLKKIVKKKFLSSFIKLNLQQLLGLNGHLGHHKTFWISKNNSFLYGCRNDYLVINLDYTFFFYNRALNFIIQLVSKGGFSLIIHDNIVNNNKFFLFFNGLNEHFFFNKWLNGLLNGFKNIKITLLNRVFNKKDIFHKRKNDYFGIEFLHCLPFFVICNQTTKNFSCIKECSLLGIPTIGFMDTNYNFSNINYKIPLNDDNSLLELYNYSIFRNSIILGYYKKYFLIFEFLHKQKNKQLLKYFLVKKYFNKKKQKIMKSLVLYCKYNNNSFVNLTKEI